MLLKHLVGAALKPSAALKTAIRRMHGEKVDVNGIGIHFERVGSGDHKVLLMPGAWGTTRTDFDAQLNDNGMDCNKFTLIAWDPPGYGFSRPPDRDFDEFYRKDASMAAKLMDKLGYSKYSVMGWSDGGITGLILAAAKPDSVSKLVVWGSNAYVAEHDRAAIRAIRDVAKWSSRARESFLKVYGDAFFEQWPKFVDNYANYDDICKQDLKDIVCPVFVIHGDKDPLVGLEHPEYLKNNIKNAQLHRFPDGKHNIHQRYAQEFNRMVEEFLLS